MIVFATRRAEIKFWTTLANAIYDGYPWYHTTIPTNCCTVCAVTINLGLFVEDKVLQLKEKTNA